MHNFTILRLHGACLEVRMILSQGKHTSVGGFPSFKEEIPLISCVSCQNKNLTQCQNTKSESKAHKRKRTQLRSFVTL
jgi:hypothetical protein